MNKLITLSTLILCVFNSFGQDLTCSDFKEGTFFSNPREDMPIEYKVIREGNSQIEIITADPQNLLGEDFAKTQYQIVEWINDCTYRLTYDVTKMDLTDYQKLINESGGPVTEITKIENDYYFYKSTLKIGDQTQTMEGKMCMKK